MYSSSKRRLPSSLPRLLTSFTYSYPPPVVGRIPAGSLVSISAVLCRHRLHNARVSLRVEAHPRAAVRVEKEVTVWMTVSEARTALAEGVLVSFGIIVIVIEVALALLVVGIWLL